MLEKQWLGVEAAEQVESLLVSNSLMESHETIVGLEPAGSGNMNVTLRVTLEDEAGGPPRSLIVKQSRPFVAKYSSIAAPLERIEYESAFYRFAQSDASIAAHMPAMLAWIPEHFVLALEDLGRAADATSLYAQYPHPELPHVVPALLDWLHGLHTVSGGRVDIDEFCNRRLRALNHAHIFEIPFQEDPAIDLDAVCPGLNAASQTIRRDAKLRSVCRELGRLYLSDGGCLLHGDYYPGSWLLMDDGPRVIDPEFCFVGPAEFDLGVLLGHLHLVGCEEAEHAIQQSLQRRSLERSWDLVQQFAAVEVLRRLLGVAQLPLPLNLEERQVILAKAASILA